MDALSLNRHFGANTMVIGGSEIGSWVLKTRTIVNKNNDHYNLSKNVS